MARIVSFVVLVAILLIIGGLFFQVMAGFLLPMFLAVLLVVMFGPLHDWFVVKCKGRDRLAAGLTTGAILLIISIPLLGILAPAVMEAEAIYSGGATAKNEDERAPIDVAKLQRVAADKFVVLGERFNLNLSVEQVEANISRKAEQWLAPMATNVARFMGNLLIGLGVMIVSLYYFLADGPAMVRTIMRLSPMDDKYEQQLVDQFVDLTRAVVIATLLSAVVQGLLAGIGFFLAGVGSVFLLTALAMLFAMVPFVGCALVWVPACFWLLWQNHPWPAAFLAVYCVAVVSMADNVIKPIVLHGRSNLHPLLALLSVLGGVQALGPIGIFVGPMVVAFLQTLLNMLRTELDSRGGGLGAERRNPVRNTNV